MPTLLTSLLHIIAEASLLLIVGFFSSAETALFTLSRHQVASFRSDPNPFLRLAAKLLEQPQMILVTILLGNMVANVLFFATASILLIQLSPSLSAWQKTALGLVPPLAIIFFGGVLPKVVAASYPKFVAGLIAGPLYVLHRILRPVCVVLQILIITPAVRLLMPPEHAACPVSHEELQELLEHSAAQGLLAPAESLLLREVVELGTIKVREVAVPRVDMVVFDITADRHAFLDLVRERGVKRIPVYRDEPDNLVGVLHARDVLVKQDDPLEDLVQPVSFVPETKPLDRLLREFQQTGRELAVAVDEYGGVTGLVTLKDVIAEVVGDVLDPGESAPELVRQIGDDVYLVSARLSIREWAEVFGHRFADTGVDTIAGMITSRLGRLARVGDTLKLLNLVFTVTKVHRHRIVEVKIERQVAAKVRGREVRR